MKRKVIIVYLILLKVLCFSQEESIREPIREADYIRTFNNGETLTIKRSGLLTINDFSFNLFQFPETEVINDHMLFKTLVYKDYIVADVTLDTNTGGYKYILFANYITKEIIFHRNLLDFPSGFMKVVGFNEKIIFVYAGGLTCYDTVSKKYSWKDIWNEYFNNKNYSYDNIVKNTIFDNDKIIVTLKNNKKYIFDYNRGRIE